MKQRIAAQNPHKHQCNTDSPTENAGCCHSGFQPVKFLCAKSLRNNNRAAHITAECKRNKNQGNFVTVPYSRQRIFTDKLSGNKTVCYVIELLENNAAKKRKAEFP